MMEYVIVVENDQTNWNDNNVTFEHYDIDFDIIPESKESTTIESKQKCLLNIAAKEILNNMNQNENENNENKYKSIMSFVEFQKIDDKGFYLVNPPPPNNNDFIYVCQIKFENGGLLSFYNNIITRRIVKKIHIIKKQKLKFQSQNVPIISSSISSSRFIISPTDLKLKISSLLNHRKNKDDSDMNYIKELGKSMEKRRQSIQPQEDFFD